MECPRSSGMSPGSSMIALSLAFLAEASPVCSAFPKPASRCFGGVKDEDAAPVMAGRLLDMGFPAVVGALTPAIHVT